MKSLNNIKFFVFCSGKTGSKTLTHSLQQKFGNDRVLHVHSSPHFIGSHPMYGSLKDLMINNSKKHDKIYIIDSYREPFERGISSFFQNIDKHCPEWRKMTVDEIISFFNKNNLYLLDIYHSYHESWGYFNVSTDIEFDFEKGYITREYENMIFVKTRLKESYRWNKIFSDIMGETIMFGYENNSKNKPYYGKYTEFKEKYQLPDDVRQDFLRLIDNNTSELNNQIPFFRTWGEMKKFMTTDEINHYVNKWLYQNTN